MSYSRLTHAIYQKLLQPYQQDKDVRRQEFILNVLLAGLCCIGILALLVSIIVWTIHLNTSGLEPVISDVVFLVLIAGCMRAVRKGYVRAVSYVLLIIIALSATELMIGWSFELPQMLLDYVMVIVIAGILLGARVGLIFAGVISLLVITGAYLQTNGYLQPNIKWRQEPLFFDAVGFALVFSIIGIVSWLSNREIDRSLSRARHSEAELLEERDNLEVKVAERTRELERSQLIRVMELERFAAFGRIHAALIHEVANPLMSATLNLQKLKVPHGRYVGQITQNLLQIERQLENARRQLRGDNLIANFSVAHELRRASDIVQPIAERHQVQLQLPEKLRTHFYGDAAKFNQVVCNLLLNAIESYAETSSTKKRLVSLGIKPLKEGMQLTVHDRGSGITAADMQRIFDPFYSKKPAREQHIGMGIGLGIVKQFIEQDFRGKLKVSSSKQAGTRFTVTLKPALPRPENG